MIRYMKNSSMFLLILSFIPLISFAQERKVPVEDSETWLNNHHQPEKLMDAVGLNKVMILADQTKHENTTRGKYTEQANEAVLYSNVTWSILSFLKEIILIFKTKITTV